MTSDEKREKLRKKQSNYYKKNREAWNKYQREYRKRKYAEDPVYRARAKEYSKTRRLIKKLIENVRRVQE